MRRTLAAVGATLTALGLILGAAGIVATAATPQTSQANAALRYLYAHVGTDGSVAATFGPGATEDTVISVADNGYDPATLKGTSSGTTTYSYLSSQKNSITTAGGAAKYVLAWIAAGKPAAIHGAAVLAKLNKPAAAGGFRQANGAFHTTNATIETANSYSQSLAVLADLAAGHAVPAHAVGWLRCAQRPDGGFGYAINDAATTPPAFCGDSSSDTNDTAIFLQALGRAGVSSVDTAAESYLHSAQQADGGFGFPGSGSDPNSDAAVIQALVAIGQDPTGPAWTKGGAATAMSDLASFADPQGTGGYIYPGNPGPDAFTTSGIPQALALKPYGAATTIVPGSAPPPAPTPTPTSAATQGVLAIVTPPTGAHADGPGGTALPLVLLGFGLVALVVASLGRRDATAP